MILLIETTESSDDSRTESEERWSNANESI